MLSGLILAGGRSSRMGRDKASLTLPDGRTLLERQVDILRAAGVTTVFASLPPGRDIALPGVTPVWDAVPETGPLGGIAAGLRAAPAGLLLVLAVDMPGIQAAHLRKLVELASPQRGVVPLMTGQCEPLAAIYPTFLAGAADEALADGDRAVHAWVRTQAELGKLLLWEAAAEWSDAFRSWNTPGDFSP